jgi:hypothetical protein
MKLMLVSNGNPMEKVVGFRCQTGVNEPRRAFVKEYELDHAMHLANHLSAFRAKG